MTDLQPARRRPRGPHTDAATIDRVIAALGLDPRPSLSAIAREVGVYRATVARVRDDLAAGRDPHPPPARPKVQLGGEAHDRRVVALEDEVARLTKALKDAHRQSSADEAIARIVGGMAATPPSPPDWLIQEAGTSGGRTGKSRTVTPEVPVCILSDWHIGETVSRSETNGINEYDGEIAGRRVRRVVAGIVDIAKNHGPGLYPGIVVNLGGDFVSGALHPELEKTDEEEAIPSALRALDLLDWAIGALADAFGRVYVPCVAGNHGRTTKRPEAKRYVYKNFDWLIYRLLARRFALRQEAGSAQETAERRRRDRDRSKAGDRKREIVFDIPDANEVLYRVFDQRYMLMHGDMLGVKGGDGIIGSLGPIARGETKVGKQAAAIGRDYDVLLLAHWHQELWLQRVIVANALKGFDEYAHKFLRAPPSQPSQPLWFVHPRRGITSRWDVKAEEPSDRAGTAWVSFADRREEKAV